MVTFSGTRCVCVCVCPYLVVFYGKGRYARGVLSLCLVVSNLSGLCTHYHFLESVPNIHHSIGETVCVCVLT